MSTEVALFVRTLKRQLKAQGLTYRDVARALGLSEGSVKRAFASERFTLDRIAELCTLLGFTMAELWQLAAGSTESVAVLNAEQEARLVADESLLLVAICALNHWSLDEIIGVYQLSRREALRRLIALDRMGIIELLPGDRIRRRVRRDFDWLADGPIRHYFLRQGLDDFIAGAKAAADDDLDFLHAMLTDAARAELRVELRRLRAKVASLHEESVSAPLGGKRGVAVLVAARDWEPAAFRRLRRA